MEKDMFFEICKSKFSYLIEEFKFNNVIFEDDGIRLYVIYEKPDLKIKIVNHIIESPNFPIVIYIITEKKKLLNKFFKKSQTYDLDDLFIYRKCNSQVYEYLDYSKVETFYEHMSEEKIKYYEEKYSADEEVEAILDKYSKLLKDFGSDILKGNFDILPEVIKLREEYDEKYNCGSAYI